MKANRVCGIEIKGADTLFCFLEPDGEGFKIVESDVCKVTIDKAGTSQSMRSFQDAVNSVLSANGVTRVLIKERTSKGRFAGGTLGFKMEAAIQLLRDYDVRTVGSTELKKCDESNVPHTPFKETGLRMYQEQAYYSALFAIYGVKN